MKEPPTLLKKAGRVNLMVLQTRAEFFLSQPFLGYMVNHTPTQLTNGTDFIVREFITANKLKIEKEVFKKILSFSESC